MEKKSLLFGEVSGRCDTREKASHTPCLLLTGVFLYGSVEGELDAGVGAPGSDVEKDLGPGSRSMDSVFTLSDNDPNQPEVEGLLTQSDFNLDGSKYADIQMERPPES